MNDTVTIVTGASRGLGLAIAEQLLARGERVLAISRRAPPIVHPRLEAWSADLADAAPVATRLVGWIAALDPAAIASIQLVNNAGVVSRLAPLAEVEVDDLAQALRVGLEAPTLLTAAFLRSTRGWTAVRKVVLVSSGLGRRAMAGSASYCAAKAGLDHLARAVALEEAAQPHGARIVSLAPGVIDTDMQAQLRAADPAVFPEQAMFAGLKAEGRLDSAATAAAKVLKFMARADFGAEPVSDVRGL